VREDTNVVRPPGTGGLTERWGTVGLRRWGGLGGLP
jgi:hypothetical protein